MVRRLPPEQVGVVPGSTPVVTFGDLGGAWMTTLGINPSRNEFLDEHGHLLDGDQRRLSTLRSLGASRLDELDDAQVAAVVADCRAYFRCRPYRRWFDPLDRLLRSGLGASYYDGTACHLDVVQWATDPVWGQISDQRARRVLIEDGVPHLRAQLASSPHIRLVLCNGRQVIEQVRAAGLADLHDAGVIRSGHVACQLYAGGGRDAPTRWLAWSANLQSSRGVSAAFKQELADWLGRAHQSSGSPAGPAGPVSGRSAPQSVTPTADGRYLPRGLRIAGKRELAAVLAGWLEHSDAPTIGDTGPFARTAWLRIDVGGTEVVLNADTKRAAAEEFVRASAADPDRLWLVVASRKGRATKVLPGPTAGPAPGWYAYLTRPGAAGQMI